MKTFFLACLAVFMLAAPARAQEPVAAPAPDFKNEIIQAEAYLQALKTAKARFLQTAPDGRQMIGTFYLNRPGRLRFEYDPPVNDFVVADGLFIYFYDSQLGEQSNAPIGQTMADFLLREDLKMSGDIQIAGVKRGGDLLQITLTQAKDPEAGSLTLGFSENPMQLRKWRVLDSQGNVTEVELFQMQAGGKLASDLFVYVDPKKAVGRTYNQ